MDRVRRVLNTSDILIPDKPDGSEDGSEETTQKNATCTQAQHHRIYDKGPGKSATSKSEARVKRATGNNNGKSERGRDRRMVVSEDGRREEVLDEA